MAKVNHHIASIANILSTLLQAHGSLRAPEGRKLVLETLAVEETAFGHYANGNPKFPNLVSSAVASLRDEGKITTNGWTWTWGGTPTTSTLPISTPIIAPAPQVAMIIAEDEDDLFMEEEMDSSFLYDITDEATLVALAASTECFGKYSARDNACLSCPIAVQCTAKAQLLKEARAEVRAEKNALTAQAEALGVDLKALKGGIPKSAQIASAEVITLKCDISCIATGKMMNIGGTAVAIPSWGIVSTEAYEILKSL